MRCPGRHLCAGAALAAVIGLAGVLFAAGPAGAHGLGGLEPTNYEARVVRVSPPLTGLEVRVLDLGQVLRIANHTPDDLEVLGDGLVRFEIPAGTTVELHDHATHWHDDDPTPAVVRRDPGREHVIRGWTIEVRQGGSTFEITGELRWVPGPSPWPWLAVAAASAIVVLLATSIWKDPRRRVALSAALAMLVAVQLVHLVGAWGASSSSAGDRLVASVYSLGGSALAVAALVTVIRKGTAAAAPLALLAGLALALAGGFADVTSLTRSQLPFTLSAWVDRLAIALTIGVGTSVAIVGALALRTAPGPDAPDDMPVGRDTVPAGLRARYPTPS